MHGQASKPPDGYTWSGERLTRKQTTSRPENVWPDMWKHVWCSKKEAKQNGLSRNQSSTMPDNREEYSALDQTTKENKSTKKAAGRKFDGPVPAAMPGKLPIERSGIIFSRCRFTLGRYSRSHSLGFGD